MRKYSAITLCLFAALLLLGARSARAGEFTINTTPVTSNTDTVCGSKSPNCVKVPLPGTTDTLTLTGTTNSDFTITKGQTEQVEIGTVSFTPVACGTSLCGTSKGSATLDITVNNGTPIQLSLTFTDTIKGLGKAQTQTLTESVTSPSEPITFPVSKGVTVQLSSIEFGSTVDPGSGNTQTANLFGTFDDLQTPEPVSMVLMGSFLSLAGGVLSRKKRAS